MPQGYWFLCMPVVLCCQRLQFLCVQSVASMAQEWPAAQRARRRLCSEADAPAGHDAFTSPTKGHAPCWRQETFTSAGLTALRDFLKSKVQVSGQNLRNAWGCMVGSSHLVSVFMDTGSGNSCALVMNLKGWWLPVLSQESQGSRETPAG